ncbi:MAG TPA: hypothetical protein VFG52_08550 [Xanthomonadales bacterium]|nr:hypothetical protein [Xanthomonadales bacterium]
MIVARAVLTALVAAGLLSACLLTRLFDFKQQFCDYRDNFSFTTGDEFLVQLLNPILLDSDVIWLAGTEPTRREQDDQSEQMQWIVDKVLPSPSVADPAFDQLYLDMDFVAEDGKYRLHQVRMDPRFSYVLSPDLMERHAGNVCNSSWLVFARSGEIDLADADLSGQPDQQEVIDYLGQPSARMRDDDAQALGMLFEYRLRGSKREKPQYSFEFWHDAQSGELLRSSANSIRFSSTTDFVKKKMWVKVR